MAFGGGEVTLRAERSGKMVQKMCEEKLYQKR